MAGNLENFEDEYGTIAETNLLIREHQQKLAYGFPVAYAPEGRLRETSKSHYMAVMRLFYQYNRSSEDLTLELRQDTEDGLIIRYATVGTVYSADFFWSPTETIRLHIIAAMTGGDKVREHYHVYDMGSSGNAYTIPQLAWENWMILGKERVGGVGIDKRIIYLAIGDRSQIGNMGIEEFSKLSCEQVERLQDGLKPGMFLVRPSITEAGLDEGPRRATPKKEEKNPTSSSGDDDSSSKPSSSQGMPKLGGRSVLERTPLKRKGSFSRSGGTFKSKTATKKNNWWKNYTAPPNKFMAVGDNWEMIPLGPDGKPLSTDQVNGMNALLTGAITKKQEKREESTTTTSENKGAEEKEKDKEVQGGSPADDSSVFIMSKSYEGETSVEDSLEMSGVSSLCDTSYRSRSHGNPSSEEGGPLPLDDSVDVFLAKRPGSQEVINVSTDSSLLDSSRGQTNDTGTLGL